MATKNNILYINTTNADEIILKINKTKYRAKARKEKSQKLLPFILNSLKKQNLSLDDIAEIKVENGPGSFTGLRVGFSVANTIGWVKGIPVNGKLIKKGQTPKINY